MGFHIQSSENKVGVQVFFWVVLSFFASAVTNVSSLPNFSL